MNKEYWRKSKIKFKAKEIAWDKLDADDHRIYLNEGEKVASKEYKCCDCPEVHKNEFFEKQVVWMAKCIAWNDLDAQEQRSYLSEAERQINKEDK